MHTVNGSIIQGLLLTIMYFDGNRQVFIDPSMVMRRVQDSEGINIMDYLSRTHVWHWVAPRAMIPPTCANDGTTSTVNERTQCQRPFPMIMTPRQTVLPSFLVIGRTRTNPCKIISKALATVEVMVVAPRSEMVHINVPGLVSSSVVGHVHVFTLHVGKLCDTYRSFRQIP